MRRTFLISSAVALGAHALLLFGFSSSDAAPKPPVATDCALTIVEPPWVPPPDEPLLDADEAVNRAPRAAQSVPALPEAPQPVRPGDIAIPMPPMPPRRVDGPPMDRVPPVWSSVGDVGSSRTPRGDLVSLDLLDNPPRTRLQVAPQYPYAAKQSGLGGEVVVAFEVDERGVVHNPTVVSATAREFEEPTLRAVGKWRFQPGKKDGRPVRFRMVVPVVFNLNS